MLAEIAKLREENAKLKASRQRAISLKVTEKGGLSAYGLGRFPVTLYRSQWEKLLAAKDMIEEFILENEDSLTTRD
jgi:hypothetical protein